MLKRKSRAVLVEAAIVESYVKSFAKIAVSDLKKQRKKSQH